MPKRTTGFYLEESNINWLAEQGSKIDRSASWFLDKLLTKAKEESDGDTVKEGKHQR